MRGKGSFVLLLGELIRITPACAGKSAISKISLLVRQDHPRMCGEKVAFDRNLPHTRGSPPHVRGKDDEGRLKLRHVGITPAYAGKSALQLCTDSCSRDHPRVCGEKFRAYAKIWNEWGSPPRMRGKVGLAFLHTFPVGITPAYAGKRVLSQRVLKSMEDHPRVCGEKPISCSRSVSVLGSPPRMRGKAGI